MALEITPPRVSRPPVLLRRAGLLGSIVKAVNVIQRPDRQSSLDASIELRQAGVEAVWHLTTRGRTAKFIAADLDRARSAGISQVLCIRGDGNNGHANEPTIKSTVAQVCEALPDSLVGATLNQYAATPERAVANLARKLAAGATYIQTQPVYDIDGLERIVRSPELAKWRPRVVAMVMPLLSSETLNLVEQRLAIKVSSSFANDVARGPEQAWTAFTEIVAGLVASPYVDGLAVMTFEPDPDGETGSRVLASLRSSGAIH